VFFAEISVKTEQNNEYFTAEECRAEMKYIFLKGILPKKFTMIWQ
jgi:hypothetical protein